jgi:hypothetical protein
MQVAPLRRADPTSKESYRLCKKIEEIKKAAKAQQKAVEPEREREIGFLGRMFNPVACSLPAQDNINT